MDQRADAIEVKEAVENRTTNDIQLRLKNSVFAGRCSNWYIGEFGRNAASWPGLAIEYWLATLIPDQDAFIQKGGSKLWRLKSLWRTAASFKGVFGLALASYLMYTHGSRELATTVFRKIDALRSVV